MAVFTPLSPGLAVRQDQCQLEGVNWSPDSFSAVFSNKILNVRVTFGRVEGFRVLEEMIYSIYSDTLKPGIMPSGFAYEVASSSFLPAAAIGDHFPNSYGPLKHYAFISLGSCLDVVSHTPPGFEIINDQGRPTDDAPLRNS